MALILCRVEILFVLLYQGASLTVDSSNLTGVSAFAEDQLNQLDAHSPAPEILLGEADVEDSLGSPDVHSKDPEILLGEAGAEDSLDSRTEDPESFANESAAENSPDQEDAYTSVSNLMTDMVNDVVQDVVNDVTSLSLLAPHKGDSVPAFAATFSGCTCTWNEPGYSCESEILAPESMAGQPCCCCGLNCLRDHRCSNDQCMMVGYDQQKEMEDEEKRIAALLNNSDVVLSGNIPAFTVDLGKGQCTNKKIIEKCAELGLTPVCDHSSYARNAKVCWTNMQPKHWSQFISRHQMRSKGFSIPEEFDEKSMGMCFMANYPHQWALAPSRHTHAWTGNANSLIYPLTTGLHSNAPYKGRTTPSKPIKIQQMNDCSGELGCWRTLCVKKDPCSDCKSCGYPCGPCGKGNCPPPAPTPPPLLNKCTNNKQMTKKYQAKWPHCSNINCFRGMSFNDVQFACLSDPSCNGFSFTQRPGDGAPTSGAGCLKKNCVPERAGYGTRSHDYWAKGPCKSGSTNSNQQDSTTTTTAGSPQPQCASAPPSNSHLLVSGAWPCVKTGAPCKKVQMTGANSEAYKSGTGMENTHIGVTCCDANGKGSRPGCKAGVPFDQAVKHCKMWDLDLCTAEQIKSGSGEATGCRFDHGLVWTCSTR